MQSEVKFAFGDRVRHRKRPEWGTGSVVKTDYVTAEGKPRQRVSVRFPNAGVKTLNAQLAELELVTETAPDPVGSEDASVADWDRMNESEMLAPVAQRKIQEVMTCLPQEARDPFNSLRRRLQFTLDLYRFDRTSRSLVDWAVAQSRLDDPLTRFTRHELEEHFDRWAKVRDNQLRKLLGEARGEPGLLEEIVAEAPSAGRDAVTRLTGGR